MSAAAQNVRRLRLVHGDNNDRATDKLLTKEAEAEASRVEADRAELDEVETEAVRMGTGR